MIILSAKISNQGDREYNEDSAIICEVRNRFLFIVADGLGGHGGGCDASQSVCATAENLIKASGEARDEDIDLSKLFEEAQKNLLEFQRQKNDTQGMKTTMNIVAVENGIAMWGHVGDTRTYFFKRGRIKKRTFDHSVPQMLVSAGEIKEKEIRHHPDRNRLLKVMGTPWQTPQYQLEKDIKLKTHQAFLLCTDGFWEYIDEKDMEKTLKKSPSPEEWLSSMEEIVKKNGAGHDMDNYTAIAIWMS